jgi:hypothetical protein
LVKKGAVLYDLGRYPDAILSYDKALALNGHDVDAKNNIANAVGKIACMTGYKAACHWHGVTNLQYPPQPDSLSNNQTHNSKYDLSVSQL